MTTFPLEFGTSIILLSGVTKGSGQRLRQFVKGQDVAVNVVLKYWGAPRFERAAIITEVPWDKVVVDQVRHLRSPARIQWVGKATSEVAHDVASQWVKGHALPIESKDIAVIE